MTHTPGPWTYTYDGTDESRCGYLIRKQSTNVPVAFVASANPDPQREQLAALIGAAPELLDALKLIQSVSGTITLNEGWGQLPDGTEICLNELIAKAEMRPA